MLKIALLGASGRMGQAILRAAQAAAVKITAWVRTDEKRAAMQQYYPTVHFPFTLTACLEVADLVIDASIAQAVPGHIDKMVQHRKPFLILVTGVNDDRHIQWAATKIPLLWAPNASWSLNVLFRHLPDLITSLRQAGLTDWDLMDRHHKGKKDTPSGTAKALAQALDIDTICSLRTGQSPPENILTGTGAYEEVKITHRSWDHRTYAEGALRAAQWLINQRPGYYTMADAISGKA